MVGVQHIPMCGKITSIKWYLYDYIPGKKIIEGKKRSSDQHGMITASSRIMIS